MKTASGVGTGWIFPKGVPPVEGGEPRPTCVHVHACVCVSRTVFAFRAEGIRFKVCDLSLLDVSDCVHPSHIAGFIWSYATRTVEKN